MDFVQGLGGLLPEIAVGVLFTILVLRLSKNYNDTIMALNTSFQAQTKEMTESFQAQTKEFIGKLNKAYEDCAKSSKESAMENSKMLAEARDQTFIALNEQRERYIKLFDNFTVGLNRVETAVKDASKKSEDDADRIVGKLDRINSRQTLKKALDKKRKEE